MDVEIRTLAGTFFTRVDTRELDDEAGFAATEVRKRIQQGLPVDATAVEDTTSTTGFLGRAPAHPTIFNPGHVVAVVEHGRASRR